MDYTAIKLIVHKLSTLVIAEFTIFTRTDIRLQKSVKKMRAICCVAHSHLIVGMKLALLLSLGTCIVQKQTVRVDLACTKRLFNLQAEAIVIVGNARLCARCAIILLKIQQNRFFFVVWARVYIFEENPKSIQEFIGDVYCPGKYCFNREKCEPLDGYVTFLGSIYVCGKCGVWLFGHKVPIMLQEHVRTTKTDKTRVLFAKRR